MNKLSLANLPHFNCLNVNILNITVTNDYCPQIIFYVQFSCIRPHTYDQKHVTLFTKLLGHIFNSKGMSLSLKKSQPRTNCNLLSS